MNGSRITRRNAFKLGLASSGALAASSLIGAASQPAQATTPSGLTLDKVQAALPALGKLANDLLQQTGVPGLAIAVVYQDQVIYLKGFGVREVDKPALVEPDTVFQLASVSKPIASTIVAGVVGKKLIRWDDPIIQYDPGFQLNTPYVTSQVTFRDLFAHRSGLPDHAGDLLEDLGFDRATVLHRLRYLNTGNHFRSHYAYTNFGLTAAAVAAAKAAGKSWEELAVETLYQPLGMNHTSSRYADFVAAPNRALGHVQVNGRWVAKYQRDPDPESPAGGVSSTVRDLAQWMRLQLGNGKFEGKPLIEADALAETHRPQIVSNLPDNPAVDRAGFYGLGWNVSYTDQGLVQLSHSGAFNLGAATAVYLLPGQSIGIVVLTNGHPIGVPETVALDFLDQVQYGKAERNYFALLQPLFAKLNEPPYGTKVDYSKPPAKPYSAMPDQAYVGSYRNDYFGDIEIVMKEGRLVLLQGAKPEIFPMQHYERDVFLYQPTGENAYGLSAITFTMDAAGKVANVVIENLNLDDQGTFTPVIS